MLDVVDEHSDDFCVKFGMDKSLIMIVNSNEEDADKVWELGGNQMKRTEEYKYLGVTLNVKGCEKAKSEKMSRANQWYGRLASIARHRANKYVVVRELWKGMAVPSIMYGMNVLNWTESELQKLEVVQNKVGRVALGANKYACVEAIRGDMGWSTFSERNMKGNIMYKVRLERMRNERWVKKVYEHVGKESKWIKSCKRLVKKCDLNYRENVFGRGHVQGWNVVCMNGDGYNWDEKKWRIEIGKKVNEFGWRKWKKGMENKSTLKWYKRKERPMYVKHYDGGWSSELLFKSRSQSLELNARTYRWNATRSKECKVCNTNEIESVFHVIVQCAKYERERRMLMQTVKDEWGPEFFSEWVDEDERRMSQLLGITGNGNDRVTIAVKKFLVDAWRIRKCATNENENRREAPWDHSYGMPGEA